MALLGKGFFIWKILSCEGGDPNAIADQAAASGLTHVPIKIADGTNNFNIDLATGFDRVPGVVQALRARGISPWGWHYIYGNDPIGEARRATTRLRQLNLDGYIIDAEGEFKLPGKNIAAQRYMTEMRAAFPTFPFALSTYRFPSYHPQFPWRDFLEKVDFSMPQVYWEQAHNAGTQLNRTVREYTSLTPFRPIYPTGPTYKNKGWLPTDADIIEFLDTARALNLSAANFFSWDECRRDLPNLWNTIRDYPWGGAPVPQDMPEQYIAALNTRDPSAVTSLYGASAVHITSARTVQGTDSIRAWYATLLAQLLPNATFTLTSTSGSGTSRHFTWQASSAQGQVLNGNDTIGLVNDKIGYHYTFFSVSS